MKMIDVFNLMAKGQIKHGTELILYYPDFFGEYGYKYDKLYRTFLNGESRRMEEEFVFGDDFLNYDVKLVPPEEKKYLVKLNIKGIVATYLNCSRETGILFLGDSSESEYSRTKFTKQEMQDIPLICQFLADMKDKCDLIEVK